MKDPEIMLFGKKISLPESCRDSAGGESSGEHSDEEGRPNYKHEQKHQRSDQNHENKSDEEQSSNSETITDQEDIESQSPPENEPTKKTLKKPDKILPCPRCSSKDTKFCYYNNYNVNQPRHFCRGCQRYWTAGGTMRHIPVGSGRRKNKNSTASHHGCDHHNKPNFKILSFRPDSNGPSFSCKNKERVADKHRNNGVLVQESQVPFGSSSGVKWPIPGVLYPGYEIPVWNPLSFSANSSSLYDDSTPLGKRRSREGELLRREKETLLVVPKALRVDDPEEAAKSSIWATLGIKYDGVRRREGLFKSLQPKNEGVCAKASPLLQANPAALSRSVCFQESV